MKEINGLVKHDYQDVEFVSDTSDMKALAQAINVNAHLLRDIYWRLEAIEKYIQEEQNDKERSNKQFKE